MNRNFCFSCMEEIEFPGGMCPRCGYDNRNRSNGAGMLGGGILAGKFVVGRMLGRGGFGATYLGYDLYLDRKVAIKEYFPSHLVMRQSNSVTLSALSGCEGDYNKGRERAIKEGKMAAGLGQLPGIVQVYDVFSSNNTVYIVMEYIEGSTLAQFVTGRRIRLSLEESLRLLAPVARALADLHRRKVIHRDVKPENIMIRSHNQQAVLLDFGAAKEQNNMTLSNSSAVVSPGFAPPEQYNATSLDGRIDQYSFAATLYFTLTGKRPPDVMFRMASGTQLPSIRGDNPGVSGAVEAVIFKAMSLKPGARYGSMEEFWNALVNAWKRSSKNGQQQADINTQVSQEQGEKKKVKASNTVAKIAAVAVGVALVGIGGEMFFSRMNNIDSRQKIAAVIPGSMVENHSPEHSSPETTDAMVHGNVSSQQADAVLERDYEYVLLEDGTYKIQRYKGETAQVTIPQGVSIIGEKAFYKNNDVTSIVVPEGVIAIEDNAFAYCKELESISLPSTLVTVGDYAFNWCVKIAEIQLPKGLESLGEGAFSHCRALERLNLPKGLAVIGKDVFQDCGALKNVEVAKGSAGEQYCQENMLPANGVSAASTQGDISRDALKDYEYKVLDNGVIELTKYTGKGTEVTIPDGIIRIGDDVFRDNDRVTRITIPESVTYIGNYAFAYCAELKEINLPGGLKHMGDYALWDCNWLDHVAIPDSLVEMGENPFGACEGLESLTVSENHPVLQMMDGALYDKAQKKLIYYPCYNTAESCTIPQSVEIIGAYAFSYNDYIQEVRLPDSVRIIDERAFLCCKKLTGIQLPAGLETIGAFAFSECNGLIAVDIPASVRKIGTMAFGKCTGLKTVTIPGQVAGIDNRAFEGCTGLSYIMVEMDSAAENFCIDNGLPYRLLESRQETKIEEFEYKVLADGTIEITKYLGQAEEVIIPAGVSRIGDKTFQTCQDLRSVTIPEGVIHIGDYAFWDCNRLKTVNIPLSLTSIGENPFGACDSLEQLEVPANHALMEMVDGVLFDKANQRLVCYPYTATAASYRIPTGTARIGDYAFAFCTDLLEVDIPKGVTRIGARTFLSCKKLKEVVLPDGLTHIGTRAFAQCENMTTLVIPASVISIGENAFDECGSLKKIVVEKGSFAEEYCKKYELSYQYAE